MDASDNLEAVDESASHLAPGDIVAERYRVDRLLGEGGMGAVYRVQHVHMRKTMALKVLHREMTEFPEAVARFEREAVAGGRIEHENVASATDFGQLPDGSFFLVLEFVEGKSLREVLHAEGRLPAARCARIGRQIASALGAAHALTIVHRDLKPENIMLLDRDGEADFVKVLDFGIAKVKLDDSKDAPALTRIGAVFGTPEYMSPEQSLGQPVDPRSDLYSLGVMLYEMAAGHRPFEADDATSVLAQQIAVPAPPLPSDVPSELADIIERLLLKDAQDRPQSAAEVVQLLDTLSGRRAPLASPNSQRQPALPASMGTMPTAVVLPRSPTVVEVPSTRISQNAIRVSQPSVGDAVSAAARSTLHSIEKLAPALKKPVKLGPATFPTWMPLAGMTALGVGAVLVVGVTVVLVTALRTPSAPAVAVSGVIPKFDPPSVAALPTSEAVVSPDIERIEGIAIYKRKLEDWLALGHAYAQAHRFRDSALAYRPALQLERSRRHDPQLLADLRLAARDPEAYPLVVNLAEGRAGLGETGLDLLWDIYRDLRAMDDQVRAESALKKLVILSRRASKALRTAIELQAAKSCEKTAGIVGRCSDSCDSRALPRLREIEGKTSCARGSDDCFDCLRGSADLSKAIERAGKRQAPQMERGYQ